MGLHSSLTNTEACNQWNLDALLNLDIIRKVIDK